LFLAQEAMKPTQKSSARGFKKFFIGVSFLMYIVKTVIKYLLSWLKMVGYS